jgi:hypothetical protein
VHDGQRRRRLLTDVSAGGNSEALDEITVRHYYVPAKRSRIAVVAAFGAGALVAGLSAPEGGNDALYLLILAAFVAGVSTLWSP